MIDRRAADERRAAQTDQSLGAAVLDTTVDMREVWNRATLPWDDPRSIEEQMAIYEDLRAGADQAAESPDEV